MSDLIRSALIGLALVVTGAVPLHAQTAPWPEPGDRVRISSNEASGEFLVTELRSDGLVLQADSVSAGFDVPTASITGLEISRGRESRLRGIMAGGFGGGVVGAIFGLHCAQPHTTCSGGSSSSALIGAGIGALIGLVGWSGREIWQEVQLPGRLAAIPGGDASAVRGPGGSGSRDEITREQIGSLPDWDAYTIIQQFQPRWLRPRIVATIRTAQRAALTGDDPAIYPEVFQDELPFGSIDSLRQFLSVEIERIEFISALDATTLYGTGYMGGIRLT